MTDSNHLDSQDKAPTPCAAVFYDGSCPLCQREISVYRDLKPDQPIEWVDVSQAQTQLPAGQSRDALMARFHVRSSEGVLLSGAAAFAYLWKQMPGWRYLGWLVSLPVVNWLAEKAYQGFLVIRPSIQSWFRKRV